MRKTKEDTLHEGLLVAVRARFFWRAERDGLSILDRILCADALVRLRLDRPRLLKLRLLAQERGGKNKDKEAPHRRCVKLRCSFVHGMSLEPKQL